MQEATKAVAEVAVAEAAVAEAEAAEEKESKSTGQGAEILEVIAGRAVLIRWV